MAVKKWIPEENILKYDENLFNPDTKVWKRDVSYPRKIIPSNQEAYEEVYEKILSVSMNKNTGFVAISISHKSPIIAKKMA